MKKFLFKLIMKLMRSKFSRQQGHRTKATAEFARVRLRQWLLREPSKDRDPISGELEAKLESLRLVLRRWLLSDTPVSTAAPAQPGSWDQGSSTSSV